MDFVDVFHSIRRQQLLSKTQSSTAASFDALPEEELQDGDGVDDIHKFPAAEGGDQMPAASSFASNPQLRIADDEQMCLDDITRMLSNMLSHDVSEEQAREFVAEMKVDSKKLTFGEFRKAAASLLMGIRELESWVTSLELHKLVAKQLPPSMSIEDPLDGLKQLSDADIDALCDTVKDDFAALLKHHVNAMRTGEKLKSTEESNGKFCMDEDGEMEYGQLAEFFKGLDGHIGLPHPRVLEVMEDEHKSRADSKLEFTTKNYGGTVTFPAQEWEFVVAPDAGKEYPGGPRAKRGIQELLAHPNSQAAGLTEPEIIALRLYTGPMYIKYNNRLRPNGGSDGLGPGTGYVTTIHAVVSGVIKLARVWQLPENRKVYRGVFSGNLPSSFLKADKYGCRGAVEYALMSTTTKKEVAVQYAGGGRPTIFEIDVGQVDRGASLSWLSQYPSEEEVVMPPLSNLEVVGDIKLEASPQGLVRVVPMRLNVNAKSMVMEELQARRHLIHLSMVENLLAETKRDLTDIAGHDADDGQQQGPAQRPPRLAWVDGNVDAQTASGGSDGGDLLLRGKSDDDFRRAEIEEAIADFRELWKEAQERDPKEFNDDDFWSNQMAMALSLKRGTVRKFKEVRRMRRLSVSNELSNRVRLAASLDWARDGYIYYLRSGSEEIPWYALTEGKLSNLELPKTLSAEQADIVWECISSNPSLIRLVQIRGLGDKLLEIDHNSVLSGDFVRVGGEGLDRRGLRVLLPGIRNNLSLTDLDLTGSVIGAEAGRELAEALRGHSQLKTIRLCGHVPVDRARAAQSVLVMCQEETGQQPMTAQEMACMAEFLKENHSLTALSLRGNRIGWRGVRALCGALKCFTGITSLDLADNDLDARSAMELGPALKTLTCLTQLDLSDNSIGADGGRWLEASVGGLIQLTSLNNIAPSINKGASSWKLKELMTSPRYEAAFLANRLLIHGHELVKLDLAGNKLRISGARMLIQALSKCSLLESLNLRDNGLRAHGVQVLSQGGLWQACHSLRRLDLSQNKVGIDGSLALARALKMSALPLTHFVYWDNVPSHKLPEWDICLLRLRSPYRELYTSLPWRCHVSFFERQFFLYRVLSWLSLLFITLLFLLGLGGLLVTISAPRKGISGRDGLDYIPASVVVWLLAFTGWILWRSNRYRLRLSEATFSGIMAGMSRMQSEDFRPAESPLQVQGTGNRAYRLQPPSMAMSSPISVRAHPPAPPGGTDGGPVRYMVQGRSFMVGGIAETLLLASTTASSGSGNEGVGADMMFGEIAEEELVTEGSAKLEVSVELERLEILEEAQFHQALDPGGLQRRVERRQRQLWQTDPRALFYAPDGFTAALHKRWFQVMLALLSVVWTWGLVMQAILVHDNNAKCYTAIRLHALELRGGGEPSTRNVAAMGLMKDGCAVTVDGWGPSLSNAGSEEFGNVVASRDGGNLTVSGFDDCIKGNGVFLVLEPDSDPAEDPTRFIIEGKWDGHDWRQVGSSSYFHDALHGLVFLNGPFDMPEERDQEVELDMRMRWEWVLIQFVQVAVMAVGLLATAALSMLGRWIAAKHMYGSVAMVNSVIAVTAGLADTFGPNGTERFALSFLVAVIWIQIAQAAQMGKESFFRLNALLLRLCTLMIIFLGAVRYDLSITLTTVFLTFIACTVFVTACAIYLRSRWVRASKRLVAPDRGRYDEEWNQLLEAEETPQHLQTLVDIDTRLRSERTTSPWPNLAGGKPLRQSVRAVNTTQSSPHTAKASARGTARRRRSSAGTLPQLVDPKLLQLVDQITLDQLYAQARGAVRPLRKKVQEWAALADGEVQVESVPHTNHAPEDGLFAPPVEGIKPIQRAIDKVVTVYRGDVRRLLDVCRMRIVLPDLPSLARCLRLMARDHDVHIRRVKNRLSLAYSGKQTAGYRDVMVNLQVVTDEARASGALLHICEVQLALRSFMALQTPTSHERYRQYSSLRAVR